MSNQCEVCGGNLVQKKLDRYVEDLFGIPVILNDAVSADVCSECGEVHDVTIPDLEGLIAAAAVTRIKVPVKLNGNDIRFLRRALNINGKELAQLLDVTKESISRWENDREVIGPTSEKLLRTLVGVLLEKKAPAIDFDPKEVLGMAISSVRSEKNSFTMSFERIKIKNDHKKEDSWDELHPVAA